MSNDVHGHNPTNVIDAIRDRAARWSTGDRTSDGRKIALIYEGGGMRCVCSASGALALKHLGLADVFDEVYATSSGAMNAAYFLAGQLELCPTIYYDRLNSKNFINPLRIWKMLDVDWVFDTLVRRERRLDVDGVLGASAGFHVAMMDAKTGEARLIDAKSSPTPLLDILKAANAIPVYYNHTIEVEGRPMIDGGLVIPFPLEQALAHGCTDIVVFLTRSAGHITPDPSWTDRLIFDHFAARGAPGPSKAFAVHGGIGRRYREIALGANPSGVVNGANILTVCLDEAEPITRTTCDPNILRTAGINYGAMVLNLFGASPEALQSWSIPGVGEMEEGDGTGSQTD